MIQKKNIRKLKRWTLYLFKLSINKDIKIILQEINSLFEYRLLLKTENTVLK